MKLKKLFVLLFLVSIFFYFLVPLKVFAANSDISIYSPAVILMDADTGKVLYEKDSNKRMYPASTTKIMTAILALENCELSDIAKVSYNAVYDIPVEYATGIIKLDEELTMEQLLYALLVKSCNEAATVLAEHIAGSVESFSTMMNTKAIELGCTNTNFVNPNGMHNENHYSSAYDLALMSQYAMKNEDFRRIVATVSYTLPSTNKYDRTDRILTTTNDMLRTQSKYYYEGTIGIKTGYTTPAKNCMVAECKKDNFSVIAVVLGAGTTDSGESQRCLDCKTLFDYAYQNFAVTTLKEKGSTAQQIKISNGTKETNELNLLLDTDITALIPKANATSSYTPEITLNEKIKAPIAKGTVLGKIKYVIDGNEYSTNLVASHDVIPSSFITLLIRICLIIFVLWLLVKLLGKKSKKKRKKKKSTINYKKKRR